MDNLTANSDQTASTAILSEIVELLASHKLVPFFGAGISRQHLGVAAAELAHAMAAELSEPPATGLSIISDLYAERLGEEAFIAFLRERLLANELDEQRAPAHRLLVSLVSSLLYTTNQDNLFELTAQKYGRRYRRVVTVEDLSEASPGEPLLVKFHGDLDAPSSLVFGQRSYDARMAAENHPLDIKLRADLLGKRLLFLGYSLRDENLSKLLATVQRAFGGTLPPSYLIAFDDDPELRSAAEAFQIRVIVPRCLYPDSAGDAAAFERCLVDLCNATRRRQAAGGLKDLLDANPVNPHIVTDFEVAAVEAASEAGPFMVALKSFRATFDASVVPEYLHDRTLDAFRSTVALARPTDDTEMSALVGSIFNLRLPPAQAAQATAAFMAHCNQRPSPGGFDRFCNLVCPSMPDGTMPVAAAFAVLILCNRSEPVTSEFRQLALWWFRGWDRLPDPIKGNVRSTIEIAWPGSLASESPIVRPLYTPPGFGRGFHEIRNDLVALLAKRFTGPEP